MVLLIMAFEAFPSGTVDEDQPARAGDMGSIPSPGRFHMLRSNYPHVTEPLKPMCPRACALQQEKPPP